MTSEVQPAMLAHEASMLRRPAIRVGVLCDFREEGWHSMDLVGDMLCQNLSEHCSESVTATQLIPRMRKRFQHIPLFPGKMAQNADRLMNRFSGYASWLAPKISHFDSFHLVDHSYSQLLRGLPRGRTIVTCHDLDTFRCLLEPERDPRPRWFRAMTRRILDGFRQAAHVIAVSNATRTGILQYGLFPPESITVIPNGVHPLFSSASNSFWDQKAAEFMPDLGLGASWLLSVGNTLPRKRLDVLLRVFAAVRRSVPGARLVRVGGFTPELSRLAAELGVEPAIVNLPFLERDALAAVYRRATLLLHTADAEGFGLPLIEAMSCGCPVAASDLPVLREVGGTAACYSPAGDVDAWASTVTGLLAARTQALDAWETRRELGRIHARGFSWAENARQTALVYQNIMECR
jgi:glycosyltransferase involved in cell wall biosynthesis